MEGGAQIQISAGRNDGWEVGPLLGALCRSMGINRDDVGNIKLRENSANIEISARAAELLESRKPRMAKEGLVVSATRAIMPSSDRAPRSGERRYRPGSRDRADRAPRSHRSDSEHGRGRRYS
jgi:ATP-dependent RNA helicase DeaD